VTQKDDHSKALKRILLLSRLNAYSIVVIAGSFGLLCVVLFEPTGIVVGAAVTAAGLMEIRGHRRLRAGVLGARAWMAGSQAWLVGCVLIYCAWRLLAFDPEDPLAVLGDAEMLRTTASLAMVPPGMLEDLVTTVYTLTYKLVAVLTVVFQGGLALYYWVKVGRLEGL
jgi:hypothetical protein